MTDALRDCEHAIQEGDELQWRQVHPFFVRDGVVAAEGFVGPQPGTSEVSVVRSSVRTCDQAFEHHTAILGLRSAGTWAITVGEVHATAARAVDDSNCPEIETPGHAFVDLRDLTKNERKRARVVLATAATNRGQFLGAA